MVSKSLDSVNFTATDNTVICSNHFVEGQPTSESPFPSIFLTASDTKWKHSPLKRKKPTRVSAESSVEPAAAQQQQINVTAKEQVPAEVPKVPMQFSQITRESDVRMFTGLRNPETFQFLFDQLSLDAKDMMYWRGEKLTN